MYRFNMKLSITQSWEHLPEEKADQPVAKLESLFFLIHSLISVLYSIWIHMSTSVNSEPGEECAVNHADWGMDWANVTFYNGPVGI